MTPLEQFGRLLVHQDGRYEFDEHQAGAWYCVLLLDLALRDPVVVALEAASIDGEVTPDVVSQILANRREEGVGTTIDGSGELVAGGAP